MYACVWVEVWTEVRKLERAHEKGVGSCGGGGGFMGEGWGGQQDACGMNVDGKVEGHVVK